jgi:hypothetical protein
MRVTVIGQSESRRKLFSGALDPVLRLLLLESIVHSEWVADSPNVTWILGR